MNVVERLKPDDRLCSHRGYRKIYFDHVLLSRAFNVVIAPLRLG